MEEIPKSYCRACGRGITKGDWFCGYCGTYALKFGTQKVLRYDGVYVFASPRFGDQIRSVLQRLNVAAYRLLRGISGMSR
jgi:hypothetical protein